MPKYEQSIVLTNVDKETVLAIGFQAMKNLNWTIQFAGEDKILGNTPKNWKTYGQQILISAENDLLTICSEMVKGESFDIGGKNKKNVEAFVTAFKNAKTTINDIVIETNKTAINTLRTTTLKVAEVEQQQAAEVDKAMNISGSNLYVTYAIVGINVLIFILMAINGAGIFESDGFVHIRWGSNYTPLTLSGDWWRLLTNVFIHFGIIHLAMNMYCLYTVGVYLEPMLGKVKYIAAYMCTGILASIVSLWWHKDVVNSAGASGAIFGLYGLFLAMLTTNLIPKQVRKSLLQSIGIFVVYNLAYGMKSGVDNSAHVGGLLSGFVIGYIYVYSIKKEKAQQKLQWIVPVIILLTVAGAYSYLQQNKTLAAQRNAALNEVKEAAYSDTDKFNDKYNEFVDLQDKALLALKTTDSMTRTAYAEQLMAAISVWDDAVSRVKSTSGYTISEAAHKKADKVLEYIQLRKEQFGYLAEINKATTEDETIRRNLEETETKISKVLEELKAL